MQHFKSNFSNPDYFGTFSNVQQCLRLNDLDEVGDLTHYLNFHMLGFFSFREWSLQDTIDFWLSFMKLIDVYPDYVTLHEDKIEWSVLYPSDMKIVIDNECKWSDGNIGGYCTEFYKNGVEIGNIVNTLGTCTDVGFGCERLLSFMHEQPMPQRQEILKETVLLLIESGIKLGNTQHGYIMKKLLTELVFTNVTIDHEYFNTVYDNQLKTYQRYMRLYPRNIDKSREWWKSTHGIDIDNIRKYQNLK